MFSLFGIKLNKNKNLFSFLIKIYGIGHYKAKLICKKININLEKKLFKLNSIDIKNLINELKNHLIENDLRLLKKNRIKNLINLKSYRGMRHKKGLPCRGQRTKTNAKTSKRLKKNEKNYKKNQY